jgi:hypothetical protein
LKYVTYAIGIIKTVTAVMLGIFTRFLCFVRGPFTTSQYAFFICQLFYYILPPPILPVPEFKGLAVTANEAEKKNFSAAFFSQNAGFWAC